MNKYQLNKSLLRTLVYSDIFDSPLTLSQLHTYLYKYGIDRSRLSQYLSNVSYIKKIGRYYVLTSRENIVSQQLTKARESRRKMRIAKQVARVLSYIPTIRLLGVSGSVAAENALRNADIDFFIVTRKNSLWITRFIVTGVLLLMKKKRMPGVSLSPDSICTNMWMSDASLTLPKSSMFHAREVVQLHVLVNRNNTMQKFVKTNSWVQEYFPNFKPVKGKEYKENRVVDMFVKWVNFCLFIVQRGYMSKRQTKEIVTKDFAAFHPRDVSEIILEVYHQRLKIYQKLFGQDDTYKKNDMKEIEIQDTYRFTPGS